MSETMRSPDTRDTLASRYALAAWMVMGVLLLALSWWRDPALVTYFMVGLPAWVLAGLIGAGLLISRGASRGLLLFPIVALGSCFPGDVSYSHWYRRQADQKLLAFMAAEAARQSDPHVVDGLRLTKLPPPLRQQVAQAFATGQCTITHRDDFLGSQETHAVCLDTLDLYIDMHEGPHNSWRFDVFVWPSTRQANSAP